MELLEQEGHERVTVIKDQKQVSGACLRKVSTSYWSDSFHSHTLQNLVHFTLIFLDKCLSQALKSFVGEQIAKLDLRRPKK